MRKLSVNNNHWIRSFLPWLWLLLCHLAKWFPDKFFISLPWSEGLCSSPFFLNPDDNMQKVISHLQCQRQEWRMEVCLWRRRSRNNMKSLTGMQPIDSGREDHLLLLDWVKNDGSLKRGENNMTSNCPDSLGDSNWEKHHLYTTGCLLPTLGSLPHTQFLADYSRSMWGEVQDFPNRSFQVFWESEMGKLHLILSGAREPPQVDLSHVSI